MLRSMRAVVTPQSIINDCMDAVQASGLGRNTMMDMPLSLIDHFGFVVHPDDYETVSEDLTGMLERAIDVDLPIGGQATMGLRDTDMNTPCWFHRNPLPALAAVSSEVLSIQPGGGYVAINTDISTAYMWLRQNDVEFEVIQPYGVDALWVPLNTPDYGVGPGYYAMCVVSESMFQTTSRLGQLTAA